MDTSYDAVVIGGGHNGLTCAAYLAGAGRSVLVLERSSAFGGAARSERLFPGALVSKYAYLVSLLPPQIVDELGLDVTLRRRHVSSYTPVGDSGILVDETDPVATRRSLGADTAAWEEFAELTQRVAGLVFPTLTEPLISSRRIPPPSRRRRLAGALRAPAGGVPRRAFLARRRPRCAAHRCADRHLHPRPRSPRQPVLPVPRDRWWHGTLGRAGWWDGDDLGAARRGSQIFRGAELRAGVTVEAVETDGRMAVVTTDDGQRIHARQVFSNAAPAILRRLLGHTDRGRRPEGAQVKINMLLSRLPRLRDRSVGAEQAFAGTFHVNEGYSQLETAYRQAAAGEVPGLPPCEVYCHSLTDPTILDDDLRAAGAQTLTLFALHMPERLFRADPEGSLEKARHAILRSLDSVLDEPIEACLVDPGCIEVMGPREIEANLAMPGGHIFHRDLQWPFAEDPAEEGRWGVETEYPNVFICGAGTRRGGGVSGIPGRNAAMAALAL